ncbi:MAG: hypothetical protein Q9222_004148 [Ikaeria aurantiellina]
MSNLTPSLNDLLRSRHAQLTRKKGRRPSLNDEFLKEAYSINSHILSLTTYLHSIRHAYLSLSPPPRHRLQQHKHTHSSHAPASPTHFTNPQRDQLDAESKSLLRSLHASIHQLEEAETLRQETARKLQQHKNSKRYGLGGTLGRWAAGDIDVNSNLNPEEQWEQGGRETLKTWRESVIWYLKKKLEEAGEIQRSMMDRRLQREVERSKSVLYKSRGGMKGVDIGLDEVGGGGIGGGGGRGIKGYTGSGKLAIEEEDRRRKGEDGLTEEQVQAFKEENEGMLRHYEDTLDQVRTAEKSMLEVSELQTTLAANLETQASNIEQLVADSLSTTENVGSGNKELKRATERKSTARMVFFATCGLCAFLVTWDLVF